MEALDILVCLRILPLVVADFIATDTLTAGQARRYLEEASPTLAVAQVVNLEILVDMWEVGKGVLAEAVHHARVWLVEVEAVEAEVALLAEMLGATLQISRVAREV